MRTLTRIEIISGPDDLGRYREIGWVAAIEAFLVWERASMARAIHVTST